MTDLLDALASSATTLEEDVDGRRVRLTTLDRVLWPQVGGTKRDLVSYYVRIAHRLLPHVVERPLTLARYPEGIEGPNWFQTRCPHPPEWVSTHPIRTGGGDTITRDYCVIHDLAGLLWVVNLGTIELHPLLARSSSFDEPDALVFDLDPGPPAELVEACRVALRLRDLLSARGLESVAKTSGALGLHVVVPLSPGHAYADTKRFARAVADELAGETPDEVVAVADRSVRAGKVFVDWSQNDPNRSTISVYSMRALPWPAASAPLRWNEVEEVARSGSIEQLPLHAGQVVDRAAAADLFAAALSGSQSLP